MLKKVLIVEDDPLMCNFLKECLIRLNKQVFIAINGQEALDILKQESFDLIITDMKMPKKSGLDVLKYAKNKNPNSIVIIVTAFAKIPLAVEAMRLGAFNYLIKPFSFDSLEATIKKAQNFYSLQTENSLLKKDFFLQNIIAVSPFMKDLVNNIEKIAKSSSSVLINGESGVGKEVIAHLIHQKSLRKDNPFIKVNCAAISPTLLESEFFGHEKGAFTNAIEQKKGRFELADKGSLLLDEITEIPINLQAKLLRALQEKEFERVGGIQSIKVDIRFISTTNKDIYKAIKDKSFREDLFYRLNVIPITILALRQRKEDILPLAESFLKKFCLENNKKPKVFSEKAKQKLYNYFWPGNVRELANIIERAVVMDLSNLIDEKQIILDSQKNFSQEDSLSGKKISDIEKIVILKTLKEQNFDKTKTAKILGITTKTLRNKIKLYNSNA